MTITELQQQYAAHPNTAVMERLLKDASVQTIFCGGLCASSASLFSSVLVKQDVCPFVFVLGDLEEAGYFYHDLTQVLGTEKVLFFPSSFRRSIKYGQKDAANEILRTEVLSRLQKGEEGLCIVTYPDALAEKVVSRKELSDKTLKLNVGEKLDTTFITDVLHSYGFEYVDYVYEPGQYAVRGSIIDVFSFASEYPYRIDFFGDEVESIRTFEVESQLSRERKEGVAIVPDLAVTGDVTTSFLDFIPKETVLAMRDFLWLRERIQVVHDEALTPQAIAVQEAEENGGITLEGKLIDGSEFTVRALDFRRMEFGNKPTGTPDAKISFHTSVQPIFHKNFDLVAGSFKDYLEQGYSLYICSDSTKQTDRIRAIFEDRGDKIQFTPVVRTIHEGFVDHTLHLCIFTDHQLFDRFHKYNLKSDKARSGKVALSLKELNQFTPGDYVVHTDHGIGRFSGLVRIPNGDTTQEVLKLVFQNEDVVFVSIHSLHKVSKYKGKDGEAPRLNKLGTGAWEKLKDRTKAKIKDIARDLSVISTPPPNRYPIQTEVHTFNEEVITDAINFEMSRNGQVFFVNDRIANLPELKAMIERHIPDCRVAIGHGQMEPTQLEQIIFDFVNYDYDVLLATTIIESGIDIPNANTIIINQAQNFGLSDLHQMRGRVGRSNKKAFCYLLAPPLSSLTAEGKRRLQAIENFSDLGSGIHIAMQDLDIRGAGNLLGAEQSGFIADLGYETYQKILAEAVHELRNDEFAELYADEIKGEGQISGEEFVDECQIESDLELLLPATYVTGSSERMLLYRELDGLTLDKDVDAFRFRLEDRFGPVPPETQELLRIVPLRRLAARLGVEKVFLKGGRMTLFFVSNADSPFYQSQAFGKMIDYMMKYTRRCDLREQNGRRSMLIKDVTNVETAVSVLQEIVALPVKELDDH